jgi:uncharacterized protein (UPF0332 family)
MKNIFLNKLKKEKKLELVEPSEEICQSYLEKSDNSLKSAKLLLANNLYENSVGMSYYAMYNSLTALLVKTGIKCENHSGSILILKLIFDKKDLFSIISDAKKERIDKQYYITEEKDEITKEVAEQLLQHAEDFALNLKVIIKEISNDYINGVREIIKNI